MRFQFCLLCRVAPNPRRCTVGFLDQDTLNSVGRWGVCLQNVCFSRLSSRPSNFRAKRTRSHLCMTCVQACATYEEPASPCAQFFLNKKTEIDLVYQYEQRDFQDPKKNRNTHTHTQICSNRPDTFLPSKSARLAPLTV